MVVNCVAAVRTVAASSTLTVAVPVAVPVAVLASAAPTVTVGSRLTLR